MKAEEGVSRKKEAQRNRLRTGEGMAGAPVHRVMQGDVGPRRVG